MTRQIDSLRRNRALFDRALDKAYQQVATRERGLESMGREGFAPPAPVGADKAAEALRGTLPLESLAGAEEVRTFRAIEAIILAEMRPAYFILGDEIEIDGDYDHIDLVRARKSDLEALARRVGRVDLIHHPSLPYAGTGWLIDDDIVVTNRHVAEVFTERTWTGGYSFAMGVFGERMEARLDTVRQRDPGQSGRRTADVLDVLYVAGPREPDIAFLKVAKRDDLPKLDLASGLAEPDQPVAAIGYPASDPGRNDPDLMNKLFKGVYDVKRFSPGLVTGRREGDVLVLSDYTSLGGSSGSAILDIDSGKVVGLHFAGVFRDANHAVAADVVKAALARVRTSVAIAGPIAEFPPTPPESFAGRHGYDPGFLGDGDLAVPMPDLGDWADDVAPVADDPDGILRYTHFSTIQSASRRLPLVTMVNIDGDQAFELKRRGEWRFDGRLDPEHQIGNELYANNPIDRGHMVRRRDPGWGADRDEAQQGEIDTFHYTNAAPQHEDLNQKDWSGLEDYILGAAETRGFKVSVFTGPVFRDDDPHLRPQVGSTAVAIPEEFWKIAVMVNDDTGQLSATGYVLSQGRMIRPLTEAAFVLGEYATYQVKIAMIEEETGLDFGRLRDFDPLGLEPESLFGRAAIRIEGPESLRLGSGSTAGSSGPSPSQTPPGGDR